MRHLGMTSVPVKQSVHKSTVRRVRPRRDFAAMEERRMRAADMFEQGVGPAEIARQVGVSHQIVSDWRAAWRRSGREGLRAVLLQECGPGRLTLGGRVDVMPAL